MAYSSTVSEMDGEVLHECVACQAHKISFLRKKNYQYTQSANQKYFYIYRCDICGTAFLNQPPHVQWLKEIYQYSGQALTQPIALDEVLAKEAALPNCTLDAKRMSRQAKRLSRSDNKQALDIGSGFGFYTQALRKVGYQTVSINPGRYENEVFRKLNGDEPLPVMFEDYQTTEQFGVVMMSQVLEHLLGPDRAISKVSELLVTGGVLACAVPNYDSFLVKLLGTKDNACLWVPEHVNFFTEKGLRALVERNGLRVVKVEQITRVPFNALSKRLGLKGWSASVVDSLLNLVQPPFTWLMNALGLGIYINLYAVKQ
jgi:SAM-dependent methyltransferase